LYVKETLPQNVVHDTDVCRRVWITFITSEVQHFCRGWRFV